MAGSISRPRQAIEPRSGGKIVRARRNAGPKTRYDRPRSPPNSSPNPRNPNWLSRLIYSPTRMIATGAGKLLSSVFTNDDSSSSSSSSSSDSDSDDNIDDDNENDAADAMKRNGSLEISEHIRSKPQPIVEKSFETKRLIEQLLIQVTFSREECDRLTSIIKSRVDNGSITGDTEDRRLTELYVDMPDNCSVAVMEAKRWLEEKKSASSPKSELELGTCTLNSAMSPHVTEGELGSPVDMAKSYMLTRPSWASPSANPIEYRSPSPTEIQLFKEETPYSSGYTSFMSSKIIGDCPASGSWNILEEIRKVRSNATEEMLRTSPSSKIDWTSFALENKSVMDSTKPVAASVNVASGASTYDFPVKQLTRDMIQTEAVPPNPATAFENQALEGIQTVKETTGRPSSGQRVKSSEDFKMVSQSDADAANIDGLTGTNGSTQPFNSLVGGTAEDSGLNKQNCSTSKELAGKSDSLAVNGFPTPGSSLSGGQDKEQNSRPSYEDDEVPPIVPSGEVCEFSTEPSGRVPEMYEKDGIVTGSQNSYSIQDEGLSQDLTRPNTRRRKAVGAAEKQQGKKLSRYNRRGRGRGK